MSRRVSKQWASLVLAVVVGAVTVGLGGAPASAQSTRERLADYLLFYYVGAPNNSHPNYKPQLLDNDEVMAGTESGDFWLDRDMAVLHDFVRAALQEPPDAATARFQLMLSQILDIRGARAGIYLIDDLGQPLVDDGRVARRRYGASVDSSGQRVWPSASASGSTRGYAGSFSIGAHYATSADKARGAFLHELTHLELETDERPHLFVAAGKSYVYGADGDHYSTELIPDLSRTFDEAVANSMELLYDEAEAQKYVGYFQPDDVVSVEIAPDPSTVSERVAPEIWLDDQIRAAGVRAVRTSGDGYAYYEIRDLPSRFIVHNELVLALVFSEYARRHLGMNDYVDAIREANRRMTARQDELRDYRTSRLTISSVANFVEVLCEKGAARSSDPRTTSTAEPSAALLPLAYLDYFTGLAAQSPQELSELFEGQLSEDWIAAYWTQGRPVVDAAVGAGVSGAELTTRDYADLDRIADAFGAIGNQL